MNGVRRTNLPIPLQHSVVDVAYDYYGKRLATSSSVGCFFVCVLLLYSVFFFFCAVHPSSPD